MEAQLRSALNAIKGVRIPDLPKEILELDAELAHKFPNNQNLVSIIKGNTKLSGEVLRLVNLPAMKPKTPIKTIREAVDSLGHENIKNLVISAALKNLFNQQEVLEIIEHSTEVAVCCATLSEFVQGVSRDEAYLVGLFQNSGSLILATKDPDNYPKMFSNINVNPVLGLAQENEAYGSTHDVIGILLAQKWKLPLEIINAILNHHLANTAGIQSERVRAMIAMIKIANYIVNEISLGSYISSDAKAFLQQGKKELMLSDDEINDVRRSLIAYGL